MTAHLSLAARFPTVKAAARFADKNVPAATPIFINLGGAASFCVLAIGTLYVTAV